VIEQRAKTLRNPSLMVLSAVIVVVLALFSLVSDVPGLFWAGIVFVLMFGLRPSLKITPDGLIVSNVFPRTYRWSEIARVELPLKVYPIMTLQLGDGGRKRVWAVGVGRGGIGEQWARQTVRRVRSRWHQETGTTPERDFLDLS